MQVKERIKKLPDACGVYIMSSRPQQVLYIGKAVSLKKRVLNHFSNKGSLKSRLFTEQVSEIEYILCNSEEQALLLEASLIREKKPKYNVELKDDKSYPYVVVTKQAYPRVYIDRPRQKKGLILFGPFTNKRLLVRALKLLRQIFPFCTCKRPHKSCLYRHLNLCPGPWPAKIVAARYRESIDNLCKVLSGERKVLIEKLQTQMERFVQDQRFEQAAELRDKLLALYTLYSGKRQVSELLMLKQALGLRRIPATIEAIDISSLFGQQDAGSVVVFKDGLADNSSYRRYKIKGVRGVDDCRMIAEVVRRRYSRLKKEKAAKPGLIIIDGGYAHVNVAKTELDKLRLSIPIIGIAKKNEQVYFPGQRQPLVLAKDNHGLQLIQRIRDEAHRFARKYHLLLRKKKLRGCGLNLSVSGIERPGSD